MRNTRILASVYLASCFLLSGAFAGVYGPQPFDSFAVNATDLADGSSISNNLGTAFTSIQNKPGSSTDRALRLTQDAVNAGLGAFKLPVLDGSQEIATFDATFKVRQFSSDPLADGFSFNFGAIAGGADYGGGEAGFNMPNGLVISFDTYANFAGDAPLIKVISNGVLIASVTVNFAVNDNTFHNVVIHWDASGLDMTYDGAAIFTNLALTGFSPRAGDRFGFSGRTGGLNQDTMIDDLHIVTAPVTPLVTSDVVITEFLADNGDGIQDEDSDRPDWIELYNGTASSVDLAGWRLTNVAGNNGVWTLPARVLPAYSYLRIFASGKNRLGNVLHTNFALPKTGGYLALVKPDGVTKTSEFTYGQQSEDVSYGTYGDTQVKQYLLPPTPGGKNEAIAVLHADGRPAEEVVFSRPGGLITGPVTLAVAAPLESGAVIRYSTDGSTPTEASPVFDPATPLTISTTRNIRARVFLPGRLPGDVSSRTFLLLDSSLTNYGNTGQPFSSNLPIVVVESFGTNIDANSNPGGLRPHRPVYSVVLDKDPAAGNRARINGLVDFQGRAGMHVRGQSSSGFAQKPYAWEIWTNEDEDKSVSLLGMPAESDWILQTPYNDKTLMRNTLPYELMREANGAAGAVRTRFVEVFFNQDGGPISYADYRGIYILMERIKRGPDRIDIAGLSPLATDPAVISGGYIYKKDKPPFDSPFTTTSTSPWGSQLLQTVEPNEPNAAQLAALQGYVQQFDNALSSANFTDPVTGYRAYIEPQTFADNHLWVEIFKQIDGYRLSNYFTKDRGGKIRNLPIWDYNLSGGNANYLDGSNPVNWYYPLVGAGDYPYYSRLFQDNDFKLKYSDRYWQLRKTLFTTSNVLAKIDAWANELTDNNFATTVVNGARVNLGTYPGNEFFPTDKGNNLPPSLESPSRVENPAMRHFDRWPILGIHVWPNPDATASGTNPRTTFQSEIQWMKDWFTNRLNWIDTQFLKPPGFSTPGGNVPSNTSLTITNPNPTGTIYYTVDGTDPYLPSSQAETPLLAGQGAPAKWLVPTSANGGFALTAGAGEQQWTEVVEPPNIANWNVGTTGIGYDRSITAVNYLPHLGTNANTESVMYNVNQTAYLRVEFNIPDQATLNAIGTLILGMKYDDGFRAYINGTFVLGRNDTHPSINTNPWTAQASTIHDDNAAIVFENTDITALGKPALRVGQNVIAIHGLNSGMTSSDFLISPKLGYLPAPAPGVGAQVYTGPITLNSSRNVRSRVLVGSQWGPITEGSFVVNATPASAANLVVSEFSYDPAPSGIYTSKDLEFIVLRNISSGDVDLTGVRVNAGVTLALTGTVQALTLPAGAEIVLAANPSALTSVHGAAPEGIRIFGPFEGALDNSGETLSIQTADGTVIKQFAYSPAQPWPVGTGRSLVLLRPGSNPNHNDGYNWRSSSGVRGTPYGSDSVNFTGNWVVDSDSDGYTDGAEYLLGTDSGLAGSAPQIAASVGTETVEGTPGTYLRLTFQRSLANDQGLIIPELSTNLANWSSSTSAFTRISQSVNDSGIATEVWRTTAPVTSPRAFARLRLLAP